jgi:ABC-type spermidine/putrescine transport system permease subunit II
MLAYCMAVVTLTLFMPLLVLLMAAFSKSWVGALSLGNLTL